MNTVRKTLSMMLVLVMLVSLMGGAFAAGDDPSTAFTKAAELEAGKEYLIAAEHNGKYYALTLSGGSLGSVEIAVENGAVASAADSAVWIPDGKDHLESLATPGQFLFASSGGLTVWDSSMLRTFVYDADGETVALHSGKYYLQFNGSRFGQADTEADAGKILLFARPAVGPSGTGTDAGAPAENVEYPEPDAVRRDAVRNADGSVTLAFTSDTHYDGTNMNLKTWLEAADPGYIDAFGFCGDMGSASASTPSAFWSLTGAVMDYMDGLIAEGKVGDAVYTHGNHEWASYAGGYYASEYANSPAAARLMQVGEALVTDRYIIYCFGSNKDAEDYLFDYDPDDIAELAEYLKTAPDDIPIFILTHYPLHQWYGKRLGTDRYMAHAGELIDVLNTHDNVVVLWGHNHNDFDDNYYRPVFPGEEIVIDPRGTTRTLNFTYLAAGCTADAEYSGPDAGSATVMNKGLIVTVNADNSLDFDYCTIDGQKMHVDGPWLVRFRSGYGGYETLKSVYVEDGQTAEPLQAPEIDGYAFDGWFVLQDNADVPFDFSAPVEKNTLVTARYSKIIKPVAEAAELDPAHVYVTIQDDQAAAIGKSGAPIVLYPVPYEAGMTVGDAFIKVHELEFESGADGAAVYNTGYGFSSLEKVWGRTPQNGSLCFDPTLDKCYIDAAAAAAPGGCYYTLAYDSSWKSTSAMYPPKAEAEAGETLTFCAKTFAMDASYNYTAEGYDGDVYCGLDFDSLTDTGIDADEGYFDISFNAPGTYYIVVKGSVGEAAGIVVVEKPACMVSNQAVTLDGEEVQIAHYNVNGNNYFKLRDLACILNGTAYQYNVGYDRESRTVIVTTGEGYNALNTDMLIGDDRSSTCVVSNQPVSVNGETVAVRAYNIGGENYVRLRDLAEYIGCGVDYDAATRTAQIFTR
ncbi:MAG: metallophosphoesterase [Oscillospiraceae bacterium]|nr:metallophosphoesterase [Oscillospiraceae bacterium]